MINEASELVNVLNGVVLYDICMSGEKDPPQPNVGTLREEN